MPLKPQEGGHLGLSILNTHIRLQEQALDLVIITVFGDVFGGQGRDRLLEAAVTRGDGGMCNMRAVAAPAVKHSSTMDHAHGSCTNLPCFFTNLNAVVAAIPLIGSQ